MRRCGCSLACELCSLAPCGSTGLSSELSRTVIRTAQLRASTLDRCVGRGRTPSLGPRETCSTADGTDSHWLELTPRRCSVSTSVERLAAVQQAQSASPVILQSKPWPGAQQLPFRANLRQSSSLRRSANGALPSPKVAAQEQGLRMKL